MVILAQSSVAGVIAWSVALLLLLIVGLAWAMRLKRRLAQEDDAPAPVAGFTLSDLRQMYRSGQLSDEEFNRAREKVVAAAQKAAERDAAKALDRDSPEAIRARRLAREATSPESNDFPLRDEDFPLREEDRPEDHTTR